MVPGRPPALRTPTLEQRTAELTRLGHAFEWDRLSPDAISALLTDDWMGAGPIILDATVPLAELEGTALMLTNARVLLLATHLARVAPAIPEPFLPGLRLAQVRSFRVPGFVTPRAGFKDLNGDPLVAPRHWMQVLLFVAGLLVRQDEGYALSARGEELLDAARAGELYALLLRTFFRRFNLAYLDLYPETPGLQDLVPHWLWYRTGAMGAAFTTASDYLLVGIPRPLMEQLEQDALPMRLRYLFQTRVQDALADFGLFEPKPDSDEEELGDVGFRPTALFRRVVRFDTTAPERHSRPKLTLLR